MRARQDDGNVIIVVLLYVDDMLAFSNEDLRLNKLEMSLAKAFTIKTSEGLGSFVGMGLSWDHDNQTVEIAQSKYALAVASMLGADAGDRPWTPMTEGFQRDMKNDTVLIDESFRGAVGSLLYTATVSRPNLSTAFRILAQETERLTANIKRDVARIADYLARTVDAKLRFKASSSTVIGIEVYYDAAFACEQSVSSAPDWRSARMQMPLSRILAALWHPVERCCWCPGLHGRLLHLIRLLQ